MISILNRILHRLFWLVVSNNGRCVLLWLLTGFVFVVCLLRGFGEPILTHEVGSAIDRMPRSTYHQGVYDHWDRFQRTRRLAAGQPLPQPVQRPSLYWSWVHWRVFRWLLFFAIPYTAIAFREEVRDAVDDVITRRRDAEAKVQPPAAGEGREHGFWRLFRIDLVAEIAWEAIRRIFHTIWRG